MIAKDRAKPELPFVMFGYACAIFGVFVSFGYFVLFGDTNKIVDAAVDRGVFYTANVLGLDIPERIGPYPSLIVIPFLLCALSWAIAVGVRRVRR